MKVELSEKEFLHLPKNLPQIDTVHKSIENNNYTNNKDTPFVINRGVLLLR